MNMIAKVGQFFSSKARKKRTEIFRRYFLIDQNTKILDLGSETGSNIKNVIEGTSVRPENVYGPYDNFDPENAMVIPSLVKRALV